MAPPNIPEDADPSQVQKKAAAHSQVTEEEGSFENEVPAITGDNEAGS